MAIDRIVSFVGLTHRRVNLAVSLGRRLARGWVDPCILALSPSSLAAFVNASA